MGQCLRGRRMRHVCPRRTTPSWCLLGQGSREALPGVHVGGAARTHTPLFRRSLSLWDGLPFNLRAVPLLNSPLVFIASPNHLWSVRHAPMAAAAAAASKCRDCPWGRWEEEGAAGGAGRSFGGHEGLVGGGGFVNGRAGREQVEVRCA